MTLKDKIPNKIPNFSNFSKLGTNKIKVYAFVGPSGTGSLQKESSVVSSLSL